MELFGKLNEIVKTEIVDGVEIDSNELASMEEMMREASYSEPQAMPPNSSLINGNNMMRQSNLTDAAPITRSSLAALAGDENDLLAESPVFESAKGVGIKERSPADMVPRSSIPEVPEEPLDDQLINEINDYL